MRKRTTFIVSMCMIFLLAITGCADTVTTPQDGSQSTILSLEGTAYRSPSGRDFWDFRVLENGSVEILWAADRESTGILEVLERKKVE